MQATRYRLWWLFPTVILCGLLETVGWSARLWSSLNVMAPHPFEIQLIVTICAPTPLAAANFTLLGTIILRLGPMHSRLGPGTYTTIFLICVRIWSNDESKCNNANCDGCSLALRTRHRRRGGREGGYQIEIAQAGQPHARGYSSHLIYQFPSSDAILRSQQRSLYMPSAQPNSSGAFSGTVPLKSAPSPSMIAGMAFNLLWLFSALLHSILVLPSNFWADGNADRFFAGRSTVLPLHRPTPPPAFNLTLSSSSPGVLDGGTITLAIFTFNVAHPGFLLYRVPEEERRERKELDAEEDV
ncbi:hypothetical protein C8R45DRAFT_1214240 [Mycena sanguinolenta]|nr:hypothetical protein C8R45DRAFT_1214240 [Mycena sanguinolenta]